MLPRAARLILVWSVMMFLTYYLSYGYTLHFLVEHLHALRSVSIDVLHVSRVLFLVLVQFLYPVGGMLGDIKFGRFRLIKRSLAFLAVMSLLLIVIGLLGLVGRKNPGVFANSEATSVILALFCVFVQLSVFGFVGFFATALPFAMDQLRDAPVEDSWLFIYLYVWIIKSCFGLTEVIFRVLFNEYGVFQYNLYNTVIFATNTPGLRLGGGIFMILLLVFIFVTSLLSFLLLHRTHIQRWFNTEHLRVNPYKLVYVVSKFAYQHKVPIRRSAFTYCEDELPTGLDLGKRKYGGPFTIEEVEDVKVFYGILKVLVFIGVSLYFCMINDSAFPLRFHRTIDSNPNSSASGILPDFDFETVLTLCNGTLSPFIGFIGVPLCLIISHYFKSCSLHAFSCLRRVEIGFIMLIANLLLMLGVNIASHVKVDDLSCMFQESEDDPTVFTASQLAPFLIMQQMFAGISRVLLDISFFEFICAQSPHYMKGMLIGLGYGLQAFFTFLGVAIQTPFMRFWKFTHPSCGFVYYCVNVLICLGFFIALTRVVKQYKYRERDEPSRERQFAEAYYSNIQNCDVDSQSTS
jgi:peptide/histidine transporter 3/4